MQPVPAPAVDLGAGGSGSCYTDQCWSAADADADAAPDFGCGCKRCVFEVHCVVGALALLAVGPA